jgi:hypothetical protein
MADLSYRPRDQRDVRKESHIRRIYRHEEFPVECLQYLEFKISKMRRVLMAVSAELAAQSSPHSEVYRVERAHVDKATVKLFREFSKYKKSLGLENV